MTLKHVLKFFSKNSEYLLFPRPLREREELLCEQSELSNSGEGCKDLPSPDRHPLPGEGNKVSCAKHTVTNLFSYSPIHLFTSKKAAFTLAEVLITLAIIGVVAALTIPSLVSKYQKHVYYTQFRKAATVVENAINQYNFDHSCGQCESSDFYTCNNLCLNENNFYYAADKLGEYMNVVQWITDDNYEEVCEGYKKQPPALFYDGTERDGNGDFYACANFLGIAYNKGYGFITNDGMLFNFAADDGYGNGSIVDINGPNKGPNIYGRDIFAFYLWQTASKRWGYPEEEYANCFGNNKSGDNCGIRLLQEGKMNY